MYVCTVYVCTVYVCVVYVCVVYVACVCVCVHVRMVRVCKHVCVVLFACTCTHTTCNFLSTNSTCVKVMMQYV